MPLPLQHSYICTYDLDFRHICYYTANNVWPTKRAAVGVVSRAVPNRGVFSLHYSAKYEQLLQSNVIVIRHR